MGGTMLGTALTLVIGLMGGISVGVQSAIAGGMGQRVGGTAGSFIIHLSGAVIAGVILLTRGGEGIGQWRALPWYMLGSGAFGVLLYFTLTHTIPRLGVGAAVTLILVGELLTGLLIDQFGWLGVPIRPIDPTRIIAAALLLVSGYLLVR